VLYVDFKLDESYTPSKISIRAGDGFHNLKVFFQIPLLKHNYIDTGNSLRITVTPTR